MSDGSYDPDTAEELRDLMEEVLKQRVDDPALSENDLLYAIIDTVATVKANTSEQSLSDVADAAFLDSASGDALTRKAEEYGVSRQPARTATGVVEFSRETEASTDYIVPTGTVVRTSDGGVEFETTETATLEEGETYVEVNVEALDGGADGNLPANKLKQMPAPPSGIEQVTNTIPTGDDQYEDTNGNTLTVGRDEESDDELRDRVYDSTSIGGAGTLTAIAAALEEIPEIRTFSFEVNSSDEQKNGLDPFSMEVIIDGGSEQDIAETLKESVPATTLLRLQHGVNGEPETHTVQSDILDQPIDVKFSRPLNVEINVHADIVTDEEYIGEDELTDRVIEYTGGERTDGTNVSGLGVNEDVYEDRIRNILTDEDTGVVGISGLTLDIEGDGEDDTTEDDDGLSVIEIDSNETAVINADTIEINEL